MTFPGFISALIGVVNSLTVLFSAVALFVFFRGIVTFIAKAGDAKSHEQGRDLMIWGTVALFVLISVWGILRFFYGELGFNGSAGAFGIPIFPHI